MLQRDDPDPLCNAEGLWPIDDLKVSSALVSPPPCSVTWMLGGFPAQYPSSSGFHGLQDVYKNIMHVCFKLASFPLHIFLTNVMTKMK